MAARDEHFSLHPAFHAGDSNEARVNNLIRTHLEEDSSRELQRLVEAMDDEPLYQQFLASMQRQGSIQHPASTSSCEGPRSRSPKAKKMPKAKQMPKANAQGQADAASVQGPGSEANAQGQTDAARVQGPVSESNASGQADAQGSQSGILEFSCSGVRRSEHLQVGDGLP